jgi:hypothetical protein
MTFYRLVALCVFLLLSMSGVVFAKEADLGSAGPAPPPPSPCDKLSPPANGTTPPCSYACDPGIPVYYTDYRQYKTPPKTNQTPPKTN